MLTTQCVLAFLQENVVYEIFQCLYMNYFITLIIDANGVIKETVLTSAGVKQ